MGQFRKKPQKGGQMEVKVEAEQVAKIRNLRNFAGSQVAKIRNLAKFLQWSTVLLFEA